MTKFTPIHRRIAINTALEFACRSRRRTMADVQSAFFVSEMNLRAQRIERKRDHSSVPHVRPHWRIRFCDVERIEMVGDEPGYTWGGDPEDDVLVFEGGDVKSFDEVYGGA